MWTLTTLLYLPTPSCPVPLACSRTCPTLCLPLARSLPPGVRRHEPDLARFGAHVRGSPGECLILLCCPVRCCAVLCCAALCCAVLCCAVLCSSGYVYWEAAPAPITSHYAPCAALANVLSLIPQPHVPSVRPPALRGQDFRRSRRHLTPGTGLAIPHFNPYQCPNLTLSYAWYRPRYTSF